MTLAAGAVALLRRGIADPDTQWSLGTFGAIAEFSRDEDEPAQVSMAAGVLSAITGRGGIALRLDPYIRPFASESLTRADWNQRVALCLPEDACAMNRRGVLTELGTDAEALREEDRDSILFDLGLAALQADFCVRIDDADTAAGLRAHAGRPIFEAGNPAMGIILHANPHRVFISRLGRIEVYQPDPAGIGKKPRWTAHPCVAKTPEQRPHPSGDRADSGGMDSLRASLSAASGQERNGPAPPGPSRTSRFLPGDDGRFRRSRDDGAQAARARGRPCRETARRTLTRSLRTRQRPHRAATNEGRGRSVPSANGMAGGPRSGYSRPC